MVKRSPGILGLAGSNPDCYNIVFSFHNVAVRVFPLSTRNSVKKVPIRLLERENGGKIKTFYLFPIFPFFCRD